jgi:hypothetical protein
MDTVFIPLLILSPLIAAIGCGLFLRHQKSKTEKSNVGRFRDLPGYLFRWVVAGYGGGILVSLAVMAYPAGPQGSLVFAVCAAFGVALGEVLGTFAWTKRR